jgi:hypothetical protein
MAVPAVPNARFSCFFFSSGRVEAPFFSMRSIQSSRPLLLLRKFEGIRKIWSSDVPSPVSSGYLDVLTKKTRKVTSLCPFNLNRGEASVTIRTTFQTMSKVYEFMRRCLSVTSTIYSDCTDTLLGICQTRSRRIGRQSWYTKVQLDGFGLMGDEFQTIGRRILYRKSACIYFLTRVFGSGFWNSVFPDPNTK